jgi:hypothetical protein
MQQEERVGRRARAAICLVLGALLIVAGGISAVHAADDDDDDALPDIKLMRRFLHALGLQNGQENNNNYRERPPLVVPPTRDLPPPVAAYTAAKRNPAWPTDPDAQKADAKKKAKLERAKLNWANPTAAGSGAFFDAEEGRSLTPKELQVGKTDKPQTATPVSNNAAMGLPQDQMPPSELGFTADMWKGLMGIRNSITKDPEIATFKREPARTSLTDPPPGYRTPSPAQPYGMNLTKLKPTGSGLPDRQVADPNRPPGL